MNFQSLVYFKTVAELQHYTKAASTLFITQPALSKAIHNLEVELGVTLFQKEGRNVTLTPSGAAFYEYVKRAVDEINNGIAAVQHRADVERNIIFVSALFSNYTEFLPEKIAQFRKMNPTYRFRIEYKYTSIIVNDVLQGNSELGLCSNLSPDDPVLCSLDRRVIHKEPVGLIVGKNHPFAHRSSVSVEDLRDERFIVYIRSFRGTNQMLYDLCSPYGFEPNIAMEAYNDYGVLNSVASGDGIAIIPTTRFGPHPAGPQRAAHARPYIGLAQKREASARCRRIPGYAHFDRTIMRFMEKAELPRVCRKRSGDAGQFCLGMKKEVSDVLAQKRNISRRP